MDTKEFKKAISVLVKEKGISEDVIYDAMRLALTSAYKKNYHSLSNVRVDINEETGEISVYSLFQIIMRNWKSGIYLMRMSLMSQRMGKKRNLLYLMKEFIFL